MLLKNNEKHNLIQIRLTHYFMGKTKVIIVPFPSDVDIYQQQHHTENKKT